MNPSAPVAAMSKTNKRSYIKLTPAQRQDLIKQIQAGEAWDTIMENFSVSRSTIYFYKDKIYGKNPAGKVKKKYMRSKKQPAKAGKVGVWKVEDVASGSQDTVGGVVHAEEKPKDLTSEAAKAEPSTSQSGGNGSNLTQVDIKPPDATEMPPRPPAPRAAAVRASMEIRLDNEFLEDTTAAPTRKGRAKPGPRRRKKRRLDEPLVFDPAAQPLGTPITSSIVADLTSGAVSGPAPLPGTGSTPLQATAPIPLSSVPMVVTAGLPVVSKRGGNRRGKAVRGKPIRGGRNRGTRGGRARRGKQTIEVNKAEDPTTSAQINSESFSGIQFEPLAMAGTSYGSYGRVASHITPGSFTQTGTFATPINLIRTPSLSQAAGFSSSSNFSRSSEEQYETMTVECNIPEGIGVDDSRGTGPSQTRDPLNSNLPPHVSRSPNQLHVQHNYHSRRVLEALVNDEAFVDVTLTAEGRPISAHKLVLSAMSPYFQRVLQANPCKHPVVIMPPSVSFAHLSHIISFMYKGETTVLESELRSLIRTAELLQVSGFRVAPGPSSFTGDNPASTSSFSGFSNPSGPSVVDDRVIRITEERDASDEENFGAQNLPPPPAATHSSILRRPAQPVTQPIHTPAGTRIVHTTPNPLINPFTPTPPQNTKVSTIPATFLLTPAGNSILINSRTGTIIPAPNTTLAQLRTGQAPQRPFLHRATATLVRQLPETRMNRPRSSPDYMTSESSVLGVEQDIDIIKEEIPNDDDEDSTVFVMEDWPPQPSPQPQTSTLTNPPSASANPPSASSPVPANSPFPSSPALADATGPSQMPVVGVSVASMSSARTPTPTGMASPASSSKSQTPAPDARTPSPATLMSPVAGTSSPKSRSPTPTTGMSPGDRTSPKSRSPTPYMVMSPCARTSSPKSGYPTPTTMISPSEKTPSPMEVMSPSAVTPTSPPVTSYASLTPPPTTNTPASSVTPPPVVVTEAASANTSAEMTEAASTPTPPPPAITPPATATKPTATAPDMSLDDVTPPLKPTTPPAVEMTPPDSNTSPPNTTITSSPAVSALLTSTFPAPPTNSFTQGPVSTSPPTSPPSTTTPVSMLSPTPTPEPVVSPITVLPLPPKDPPQCTAPPTPLSATLFTTSISTPISKPVTPATLPSTTTPLTPSLPPSFKPATPQLPSTSVFPFNIGSRPFTITPLPSASKSSKHDRTRDIPSMSHNPATPKSSIFNSARASPLARTCHHSSAQITTLPSFPAPRHTSPHLSHFSTASPSLTTTSSLLATPHLATGMPANALLTCGQQLDTKSSVPPPHTPLLDLTTRCHKHDSPYSATNTAPSPSTAALNTKSSLSGIALSQTPGVSSVAQAVSAASTVSVSALTSTTSKCCFPTTTSTQNPLLTTSATHTTPVASPAVHRPMSAPSQDRCPYHPVSLPASTHSQNCPQTVVSSKAVMTPLPTSFPADSTTIKSGNVIGSSVTTAVHNRLYDVNVASNSLDQLTIGAPTATLVSDDAALLPPTASSYYMDSHHMVSPLPTEPVDYDLHSLQRSVTLYDLDSHAPVTPLPLRPPVGHDPMYSDPVSEQTLYGYPSTSQPSLLGNYDPVYLQPQDGDNSFDSFSPPTYYNLDSPPTPLPAAVASPSSYDMPALNPTAGSSLYSDNNPALPHAGSPSLQPLGSGEGLYGHPPLANSPLNPSPFFLDRAMSAGSVDSPPTSSVTHDPITFALKEWRK